MSNLFLMHVIGAACMLGGLSLTYSLFDSWVDSVSSLKSKLVLFSFSVALSSVGIALLLESS